MLVKRGRTQGAGIAWIRSSMLPGGKQVRNILSPPLKLQLSALLLHLSRGPSFLRSLLLKLLLLLSRTPSPLSHTRSLSTLFPSPSPRTLHPAIPVLVPPCVYATQGVRLIVIGGPSVHHTEECKLWSRTRKITEPPLMRTLRPSS